jgi:hypothetical protein
MRSEKSMSKNDMEVIMGKILKYLYECLKTGHEPDTAEISCDCKLFSIPYDYWFVIMKELIEGEYVSGLKLVTAKDMCQILPVGNFAITKKGRDFLAEREDKLKKFFDSQFLSILGSIVGFTLDR